jgi:hypothetical protein
MCESILGLLTLVAFIAAALLIWAALDGCFAAPRRKSAFGRVEF